jgi:hypothetical protein
VANLFRHSSCTSNRVALDVPRMQDSKSLNRIVGALMLNYDLP